MTPADLRAICDSLNDERGAGGQTRLTVCSSEITRRSGAS